jgi:toxin ParE1/3/4
MTWEFRLTSLAIADMEQISEYIATQSSFAQSDRFLRRVDQKFSRIAQFPNLGKIRDDVRPGLRSFPLDSYLIVYRVSDQCVEILRVVSGYRDLKTLFNESQD